MNVKTLADFIVEVPSDGGGLTRDWVVWALTQVAHADARGLTLNPDWFRCAASPFENVPQMWEFTAAHANTADQPRFSEANPPCACGHGLLAHAEGACSRCDCAMFRPPSILDSICKDCGHPSKSHGAHGGGNCRRMGCQCKEFNLSIT